MPRNGSGSFAVSNTFTPNTVMSATAVNANFTDAGNEITNSLARDGQSTMTGQFKADDGSEASPGITFGNDLNTGFRRASSDEMRWVGGGSDRFYIDSAGKGWFLGAVDIAGTLNLQGGLSGTGVADLAAIEALSTVGAARRTAADTWSLDDGTTYFQFTIDGLGSVLSTGILGDIRFPVACTITGASALADQSGSAVVDCWVDTYANYPPTDADTITAAAPITISTATKSNDDTLTGWTTSVAAGSIMRINLDSVTSITRLSIFIKVKRFI
jgi:TM2 domain-containing membrane protein YozV